MQALLYFTACLTFVDSKRFVLLDPDDPNLEKSASNITDNDVRSRSIKMAKFRKWLKYDVDCQFISRSELAVKISQGRCPHESATEIKPTTTTKKPKSFFFKRKRKPLKKKDNSLFSNENKESVVRAVVGNNKMHEIDWTPLSFPDLELVSGTMVTFKCDEMNRKKKRKKHEEIEFVEWFVNGKRINPSWFDWRVSVSIDGHLGIWPIGEGDGGHFECLSNGQLIASVTVTVVPISKVLVNGLFNYLFVCAIFAVATIPIGCLLGNRNQEKKEIEVDRMEEFLAENVFKTDQMAKEKVAGIIEKQGVVDERQLIESKAKGNRSTIMILLQKPNTMKEKEKEDQKVSNNPAPAASASTEGATTVTEGTTAAETTVATETTATGTGTTEAAATTVTETNEEADNEEDEEEDEDDDDDGSVDGTTAGSTESKGPGTTSKSTDKGKKKKKTKKGGKKKKSGAGKGKGKKKSKVSKEKKGGKKVQKKKPASKPTKKKK